MTGDSSKTEGESISWSVRLSDSEPRKTAIVFGAAVTAGVVGFVLYRQLLFGILGFAIILAATAEFWMGAVYRIGPKGASSRIGLSLSSMDWDEVKRVSVDGAIVRLSPLSEDSRLSPFRGVSLRTTDENRAAVLEYVRSFVKDDVRFLEL